MDEYAINISDATKDPFMMGMMLGPVTRSRYVIEAEKTIDGSAVVLECDTERAKAIVDVIRMKYAKHEIRCYHNRKRI